MEQVNTLSQRNNIYYNFGSIMSNDLLFSSDILSNINYYKTSLANTAGVLSGPAGKKEGDSNKIVYHSIVSPSLFNVYQSVYSAGIAPNIPLLDTINDGAKISADYNLPNGSKKKLNRTVYQYPINDCSISNLVYMSGIENSPLGNAKYRYSDFMYCKELGKISNNHLITLRRFPSPIQDNIFEAAADVNDDTNFMSAPSDIGRMITWFGTEDNKLDSILKYTVSATWKKLDSHIDKENSEEEHEDRGIMGDFVNLFNPKYNASTAKGVSPNALGRILSRDGSTGMFTSAPYANVSAMNGDTYDEHKIYEPKDTLRWTHAYEGNLEFTNEFDLVFRYQLRSYDNINSKSAFLDLLANILTVTYKTGTFWGGEQRIIGSPQNVQGWKKAMEFSSGLIGAGETFISKLMNGEGGDAFSSLSNTIGSLIGDTLGIDMGAILDDPKGAAENFFKSNNIGAALKGSIQNKLGRPTMYAFDSLLTNDAVGLWHITIGNPLNPIAVMGNLILDKAEIEHSGPLGLDDFPSELKVTVSLKHAMPRDSVDIQKMYTMGQHAIYNKILDKNNFKNGSGIPNKKEIETPKKIYNDSDKQLEVGQSIIAVNSSTGEPVEIYAPPLNKQFTDININKRYTYQENFISLVGSIQQAGFNINSGPSR